MKSIHSSSKHLVIQLLKSEKKKMVRRPIFYRLKLLCNTFISFFGDNLIRTFASLFTINMKIMTVFGKYHKYHKNSFHIEASQLITKCYLHLLFIFLFQINNQSTKKNDGSYVVLLVFILLTLNIIYTCFKQTIIAVSILIYKECLNQFLHNCVFLLILQ